MSTLTPGSSGLLSELSKRPYGLSSRAAFLSSIKSCGGFVSRLKLGSQLSVHEGCVNTVCWSSDGSLLLSGSDDRFLKLTSPYTGKVLCSHKTGHQANIFSAKFMPGCNFSHVITCAGDGSVQYSDLNNSEGFSSHLFRCPAGTTYDIEPFDSSSVVNNNNNNSSSSGGGAGDAGSGGDSRCFISCGEDGCVRLYDLRERSHCSSRRCSHNVLFTSPRALTAMTMSPVCPWHVCVACAGGNICLYDIRRAAPDDQGVMLRNWQWCGNSGARARADLPDTAVRATSLRYDRSGRHLLASFSGRHVLLYDLTQSASAADTPLVGPAGLPEPRRRRRRSQLPRLRVRGDWSDTGPRAQPHSTAQAQPAAAETGGSAETSSASSLVRRIESALGQLFPGFVISPELQEDGAEADGGSAGGGDGSEGRQGVEEVSRDRPVTRRVMRRIHRRRQLAALGLSSEVSSESSSSSRSSSPQPSQSTENRQNRSPQRSDFLKSDANTVPQIGTASATSDPQAGAACATTLPHTDPDRTSSATQTAATPTTSCHNDTTSTSVSQTATTSTNSIPPIDPTFTSTSQTATTSTSSTSQTDTAATSNSQSGADYTTSVSLANPGSTSASQIDTTSTTSTSQTGAASPIHVIRMSDIFADDEVVETINVDTLDRGIETAEELSSDECDDSDAEETIASDLPQSDARCDQPRIVASFSGHRNLRTMIKEAEFWGDDFIVSGSDCGHAFIWHRSTARLANILEADTHVVNRVRPHPFEPMLATSGIDYDIKLWTPTAEQSTLNSELATSLVSMNERMSEQSRDLVTVPAMFMLRMLHAFNRSRTPSES